MTHSTRSPSRILVDIVNRTALCLGVALVLVLLVAGCGVESRPLDPEERDRVITAIWTSALPIGLLGEPCARWDARSPERLRSVRW